AGFSLLHGMHHDAQKSNNTTLPFNDDKVISFPSGLLNFKSGAISPMFNPVFCLYIKPSVTIIINARIMLDLNFLMVSIGVGFYSGKFSQIECRFIIE